MNIIMTMEWFSGLARQVFYFNFQPIQFARRQIVVLTSVIVCYMKFFNSL